MDFANISEKCINDGITWLTEEYGSFQGYTTCLEIDETMDIDQLNILCKYIECDDRVEMAKVENVKENTIEIIFKK